jgi:hypothetical protein
MHAQMIDSILRLRNVPGFDQELKILFSAFTNFTRNFNLWTPCIPGTICRAFEECFLKLHKDIENMIAKMNSALMAMKAKTD